jgi:hypothetical protein
MALSAPQGTDKHGKSVVGECAHICKFVNNGVAAVDCSTAQQQTIKAVPRQ